MGESYENLQVWKYLAKKKNKEKNSLNEKNFICHIRFGSKTLVPTCKLLRANPAGYSMPQKVNGK